jgi:response regulator RpfG family c-di-GMP phosphodiesterase
MDQSSPLDGKHDSKPGDSGWHDRFPSTKVPPAILHVDDEAKSLQLFARAYGRHFRILTASNAREGLAILRQERSGIGVLLVDHRMPGEYGMWLLRQAPDLNPHAIRILISACPDLEALVEAINTGVDRFIFKPWDPPELLGLLGEFLAEYERRCAAARLSAPEA